MSFKRQAIAVAFLFAALMLIGSVSSASAESDVIASFTAESLFDIMEKHTEKIEAMAAKVQLQNAAGTKAVTLSVKNPDKFAIIFADESIKAFFNGQKLWVHVVSINEVFYHFSESPGLLASYFTWLNPKKLFTNLTRKTLFSFFKVEPQRSENTGAGDVLYYLKFTPKMEAVFKKIFDVGYYQMIFSSRNYLPVEVIEFNQIGVERGRLKVLEYKLNAELADSYFDFSVPEGAVMVPMTVVLAQKLEEYASAILEKLGNAAENLKKSIIDWSF